MGRNYYCDYCDKRLKNDTQVIKKHIAGLAHTSARNEHYVKYKGERNKISKQNIMKITMIRYQTQKLS